jgi:tetratricopeptide (TPR) repeat protein
MKGINALLADSPHSVRVITQKVNVFAAMGQNGLAVSLYDEALKHCDNSAISDRNVILNNKAKALIEEARYDEALPLYESILSNQTDFVFAISGIAVVYFKQHLFAESMRYLEQAVAVDPQHAPGWELMSQILAMDGIYEKAYTAAEKALKLNPHKAENHFRIGIILHNLSQSEAGCSALRKASDMGYSLADKAIAAYCT